LTDEDEDKIIEAVKDKCSEAYWLGYLKGLNDALTAIHEPDILWAHARAIEALKGKVST
jgi:hypothetical protein